MITETLSNKANGPKVGSTEIGARKRVTSLGQSPTEAQRPMEPIQVNPKKVLKMGKWNVRTMHAAGKAAEAARVMRDMKIQIMGIS